jgi:hypothetical protein
MLKRQRLALREEIAGARFVVGKMRRCNSSLPCNRRERVAFARISSD